MVGGVVAPNKRSTTPSVESRWRLGSTYRQIGAGSARLVCFSPVKGGRMVGRGGAEGMLPDLSWMLDDQYVLALCHLIFEGNDDPEYAALFAVLGNTPVPVDEGRSLAARFESKGADPDHASYLARLVNAYDARPDIVDRLDELAATSVPDPRITHLQALLVEHLRDQQPEAFDFLRAELRDRRDASPHGDSALDPLLDALVSLDDRWIDIAIDLLPTEPTLWEPVDDHLEAAADRGRITERLGVQRLVDAWLAFSKGPDGTYPDQHWWATSLFDDIERWADEDLHREIVLRFIDTADDQQIWNVAAGPLEDFLTDNDERLTWMEQIAAQNPRFRRALAGVWTDGKEPTTTERIGRAADPDNS